MAKFSESVINEIKKRLTITDVVSDYVVLTRKGDRLWGLCPFHHEKTPSFTVVEDKGFYHCFGCGKGGSMFDFIMEEEHVTFPEAVEILAKKAGVQLKEETPEDRSKRNFEQNLGELYSKLSVAFHFLLGSMPEAQHAREYLEKRKVSIEMQNKFMLGYAPSDTNWLYSFLRKNNYSDDFLSKTGLFSTKNPRYPLFSNRIMFPIRTWQGNCVAFGGRDLTGESRAKYINTPETDLYRKRDMLFGLYEGLQSIKNNKSVILCEGNFDVVSMQQSGMGNTVAPLGTAFTDDQARLLKRYCEKATILFDSDSAGQNATQKAIILCQRMGLESSVINLGNEKDPSEVLEKEGPETLSKSCAILSNGFDYLVHLSLKRYDVRQPKAKFMVFKEVEPFLEATASEIEKQGYIRRLSEILNISEKQILEDYQSGQSDSASIRDEAPKTGSDNPFDVDSDMCLMLMLANRRDLFGKFKNTLKIDLLQNEEAQRIYAVLEDADRLGVTTNEMLLQMIDDPALRAKVRNSFAMDMYKDTDAPKHIAESIRIAKLRDMEEKRANILKVLKLNSQDQNENGNDANELLSQIQELDSKIQEMKMATGTNEGY